MTHPETVAEQRARLLRAALVAIYAAGDDTDADTLREIAADAIAKDSVMQFKEDSEKHGTR